MMIPRKGFFFSFCLHIKGFFSSACWVLLNHKSLINYILMVLDIDHSILIFQPLGIFLWIIYIYSVPHTNFVVSQHFIVARHVGPFKLRLKPAQLYNQSAYINAGIIRLSLVYTWYYRIPECTIYTKSYALREWQPLIPSPECSTPWITSNWYTLCKL